MTKMRDAGSAHDALDQLFDQCGGVKQAAAFLGKSPYHLAHATDPDDGRDIGFRSICQLTSWKGATAAAEHLASLAGGTFVPVKVDAECLNAATAKLSKESGEGISALIEAAVDPLKRRPAIKELDDLIRAAICARALLTSHDVPPPEKPRLVGAAA